MKHPPYHLRPNKAVDRFLLVELLQRLTPKFDFSKYTYHGMGGPFLEDFRLMAQSFPKITLVSIESSMHTYRRQQFHLPSRRVNLVPNDVSSYIAQFQGSGKEIFWLDYTDLKLVCFNDFKQTLSTVGNGSIVRITLRVGFDMSAFDCSTYVDAEGQLKIKRREDAFAEDFQEKFGGILPSGITVADFRESRFISLVQNMLQIASQQALPVQAGSVYQILSSSVYSDQTPMLSVTGIVCAPAEAAAVSKIVKRWKHANVDWTTPKRIDLPVLSVKERLRLDPYLPCKSANRLAKKLGYNIGDGGPNSLRQLEQYLDFYPYYPQFAKVSL